MIVSYNYARTHGALETVTNQLAGTPVEVVPAGASRMRVGGCSTLIDTTVILVVGTRTVMNGDTLSQKAAPVVGKDDMVAEVPVRPGEKALLTVDASAAGTTVIRVEYW